MNGALLDDDEHCITPYTRTCHDSQPVVVCVGVSASILCRGFLFVTLDKRLAPEHSFLGSTSHIISPIAVWEIFHSLFVICHHFLM